MVKREYQSTDAFQHEEVCFLQDEILRDKFKINSTIDAQGRIDISSRKEVRKFQSLKEIRIKEFLVNPTKIYKWILTYEYLEKGKFLLTPRFKPDVKNKLDMLSRMTGFEISELVAIAVMESGYG